MPVISLLPKPSRKKKFLDNHSPYRLLKKYKNKDIMPVQSVHFDNLIWKESLLYHCLLNYVVDVDTRRKQGYPIKDDQNPGSAIIVKQSHFSFGAAHPTNMEACSRCRKIIPIENMNMCITEGDCCYHWGKFHEFNGYSCCNGNYRSNGCTQYSFHTWNGLREGVNGPLSGFVSTPKFTETPYGGTYKIVAIDCEMCYTKAGLELVRVSVVNWNGMCVYDSLVYPEKEILDFNTRFSGITSEMYCSNPKRTLVHVQNDLISLINSSSLIVGHGLENDLKVLKLLHANVVDTAISFNHVKGLPFRYSLKDLAEKFLNRNIRPYDIGHSSLDDARASMDLILWKVRNDFEYAFN